MLVDWRCRRHLLLLLLLLLLVVVVVCRLLLLLSRHLLLCCCRQLFTLHHQQPRLDRPQNPRHKLYQGLQLPVAPYIGKHHTAMGPTTARLRPTAARRTACTPCCACINVTIDVGSGSSSWRTASSAAAACAGSLMTAGGLAAC
jgi:hypothetical protein